MLERGGGERKGKSRRSQSKLLDRTSPQPILNLNARILSKASFERKSIVLPRGYPQLI